MENTTEEPRNTVFIDELSADYLLETSKWGRFLSILGFILTGFMVLGGLSFSTIFSFMDTAMPENTKMPFNFGFFGIFYILFSLFYFMPSLYLYRFSTKTKNALPTFNQSEMTEAFKNLKSLFKFVGVFTLVILILYGVIFLGMMIGMGLGLMK